MRNGPALSQRPTHHAGTHRDIADERLVERVAAGDRLAMEALYARHHLRIYRFVLRLVNDAPTAEDLTSDVFLDVWKQAGRFEGRSQVSTWMLSIARHRQCPHSAAAPTSRSTTTARPKFPTAPTLPR